MENFYKNVIFDITRLIINKNYRRAITLGHFLLNKGFRTTDLIVSLSYAYKIIYGPMAALKFLEECKIHNSLAQQQGKQCISNSPLIQLASSQYHIEIQNLKEALNNLNNLDLSDSYQSSTEDNHLVMLLKLLKNNYNQLVLCSQSTLDQANEENHQSQLKNSVQNFILQINDLTEAYLLDKDKSVEENQLLIQQLPLKYGQYYLQYDDIKQRILTVLSNYLKINSNNTPNSRFIKKQNKFLKDNNVKKIKKHSTKQLLFNNITNFSSLEKKQLQTVNKQRNLIHHFNVKPVSIQQNNIEQLQSLLLQVNRFIIFFKNRIKDCGASRITNFKAKNQETEDQKVNIN